MKPKIKDGVSILCRRVSRDVYEVNFLVNKSSTVFPFNFNERTYKLLKMFNGEKTLIDIAKKTKLTLNEINFLIQILENHNLIEDANLLDVGEEYSNPQINFLSAFATKSTSGKRMQAKIENSHVLILGLGGIGTWVAQSLALAGVKIFTLIDPDNVEASNLNRQCLYTPEDIDLPKVDGATTALKRINTTCRVNAHRVRITNPTALSNLLQDVQLVISCADEPSTEKVNRIVTKACFPNDLPHILCGGYDGHLGFVGPTIVPGKSPCWFCYEKSLDINTKKAGYKHLTITSAHEKGGNIAPISSIVGNFHALEAIRVLSGFSKPVLVDKTIEIDFLRLTLHYRTFTKHQGCRLCTPNQLTK